MTTEGVDSQTTTRGGRRVGRWALLALLGAGVAWALAHRDALDAQVIQAALDRLGPWAAPSFVAVYAVGALLFLPGSVLTAAGGAVFGPVFGTLLSLAGATLGATLAFLAARVLGADWVAQRLEGRLGQLVRGVEEEGWRFVAFVRLVPLFPYNLLNYALGLTRIPLGSYVAATAVCMLPGAGAYSYLGYAGREALSGADGAIRAGLVGLALLATVAFAVPATARRLRAKSRKRAQERQGTGTRAS